MKMIIKFAEEVSVLNKKSQYNTRQLGELMDYLESVKGVHVTVGDICAHFRSIGKNIGTATVYRHLERMVDDGLIEKYTFDNSGSACFEYVGSGGHCESGSCFHCKCKKCGRLIHLDCDELAEIQRHLLDRHGFELDSYRTVFYGICEECKEK